MVVYFIFPLFNRTTHAIRQLCTELYAMIVKVCSQGMKRETCNIVSIVALFFFTETSVNINLCYKWAALYLTISSSPFCRHIRQLPSGPGALQGRNMFTAHLLSGATFLAMYQSTLLAPVLVVLKDLSVPVLILTLVQKTLRTYSRLSIIIDKF